ncbi:Uncharacterised protein [Amycolatopsis camponoti]|uniref:Uncharacterized protein n=1 Tax=Amycolatopsis camponoti TaxID=2606593 RepID=A0A6I8LLK3_9PSEU|nr:Uncharacterised protein [Amycolatopsis camponoti]
MSTVGPGWSPSPDPGRHEFADLRVFGRNPPGWSSVRSEIRDS